VVLASKKEWDKLPAELRQALKSDVAKTTTEGRAAVRELGPLLLENFTNAKIPVYRPSAAERAALTKATAAVKEKYVRAVPGAKPLLAAIEKALGGR
jgi:TRAP-type C4-dicarboxylate transport system substrate-binding protein